MLADCLIEGRDDIGLTELHAKEIDAYEAKRKTKLPWFEGLGANGRILSPTYARQKRARDW